MAKHGRRGRPTAQPYETSWGDKVDGLTRMQDGRWRITTTDHRYSESDERKAVAKFYELTSHARVQKMAQPIYAEVVENDGRMVRQSPMMVALESFARDLTAGRPTTTIEFDRFGEPPTKVDRSQETALRQQALPRLPQRRQPFQ